MAQRIAFLQNQTLMFMNQARGLSVGLMTAVMNDEIPRGAIAKQIYDDLLRAATSIEDLTK